MIAAFARHLRSEIATVPHGFYDTFKFTSTGTNLTHPTTLGYIAKAMWSIRGVRSVGIDVRLNSGNGIKMQPDAVAFNATGEPVLIVDYESPNSSDARVPNKDVRAFIAWREGRTRVPPYLVITTLPDRSSPEWQVRYIYGRGCNAAYRDKVRLIRQNPFRFWYREYARELNRAELRAARFFNIDRKRLSGVAVSR